jgi:hypothetical protein
MITKGGNNSYTFPSWVSSAKCSEAPRDKVPIFRHPMAMQLFLRKGESAARFARVNPPNNCRLVGHVLGLRI